MQILRGMKDVLPPESLKWEQLERIASSVFSSFGYSLSISPVLERTELFSRSIGEETDVVSKEMYSFIDRGQEQVTLRPEGTASIMRAYLAEPSLRGRMFKTWYWGPMFRYERPQKGRLRQFFQFGLEAIATDSPLVDAELIYLLEHFYKLIGIDDVEVHVNSIGCDDCRPNYKKELVHYLENKREVLCEDCKKRIELNPLRILDCKNNDCINIVNTAPVISSFLCNVCEEHNKKVLEALNTLKVKYVINKKLVRGLDYYSRTVFEFITEKIGGRQNALGGGGRYDNLSVQLGSKPVPSVGYAGGVERTVMMMNIADSDLLGVYVAILDEPTMKEYLPLILSIKKIGAGKNVLFMEDDLKIRDIKKHLSRADRAGARFALIAGLNEKDKKTIILKDLKEKSEEKIEVDVFDISGTALKMLGRMLEKKNS